MIKKVMRKYKPEIAGVLVGAIGGWMYWYFVGCASGTCAITSSPVNSSLYGAVMGGLLFGMFNTKPDHKSKA